jgi:hypothetical protein
VRPVVLLCLPDLAAHTSPSAAIGAALSRHPDRAAGVDPPAPRYSLRPPRTAARPGGQRWSYATGFWPTHPGTDRDVLVSARPDAAPGRWACAGGPIAVLDRALAARRAQRSAEVLWRLFDAVTWNTPPARQWELFATRHQTDPQTVTLDAARRAFGAQPRIRAMRDFDLRADTLTVFARFTPDRYATALDHLQPGGAAFIARRVTRAVAGDRMVCPDGRLLRPVTDTPEALAAYRAAADAVVAGLPSAAIVVAVHYH